MQQLRKPLLNIDSARRVVSGSAWLAGLEILQQLAPAASRSNLRSARIEAVPASSAVSSMSAGNNVSAKPWSIADCPPIQVSRSSIIARSAVAIPVRAA